MSQLTFVPVADFRTPVRTASTRGSRLRGILAGLVFLGVRLPFYAGAAILAAVVCVIGVTLYGLQAALGGQRA